MAVESNLRLLESPALVVPPSDGDDRPAEAGTTNLTELGTSWTPS